MRNTALHFPWIVLKFCVLSRVTSKAMSYKGQISNRLVISRTDHLHIPLYIWEIVFLAQIRLKNTQQRLSEIFQSLGRSTVPYPLPGHLSEMQKGLWNSEQIFQMGLWAVALQELWHRREGHRLAVRVSAISTEVYVICLSHSSSCCKNHRICKCRSHLEVIRNWNGSCWVNYSLKMWSCDPKTCIEILHICKLVVGWILDSFLWNCSVIMTFDLFNCLHNNFKTHLGHLFLK